MFKVNKKRHQSDIINVFGVFTLNFEQISYIVLVFPLLTLNT